MYQTILAAAISLGAVTLAEMGDKTQLLAMAFATKYNASKVLLGVFLATILNHSLAVALGNLISQYEALDLWIQIIASLSFIIFGLWTIRGDKLDNEDNVKSKWGPIMTVTIAFFIAELGDKTQLTTIALATKFPQNPIGILLGTTCGMLVADAIGIIVGVVLCKKIPEKTIKIISATIFILFGLLGTYNVLIVDFSLNIYISNLIILILAILTTLSCYYIVKKSSESISNDE